MSLDSLTKSELLELWPYLSEQERAEMDLLLTAGQKTSGKVELADLKIRTKTKQFVTFDPNPVQISYLDELLPAWRMGELSIRRLKELILKARQFGFSTLIEALFFLDTVNTPNTTTVVVAHDADSTERLFRMVHTFYDQLPPEKQPRKKYSNKRELFFDDLNSTIFVGTAGAKDFGRSNTINNLHLTEVAFYPDPEELLTGLLQAVPEDGNIFMETTANGVGDFFNEEWERAIAGASSFDPRFFAWFQHPEYSWTPVTPQETLLAERLYARLTSEGLERERKLQLAYGLTDAQVRWRRRKMAEPGMRKKFVQEYPANPTEAFVASGNPYFDRERLNERLLHVGEALVVEIPPQFIKLAAAGEKLEVFRLPEPGREYIVAADVAEGLDEKGKDHDYDSADVIDAETWEQVAHLHGRWAPHEWGLVLAELGRWYNLALVGVERNNHGHATLAALLHTAEYPDMNGCHGIYAHEEFDEKKRESAKKLGWPTTAKTKTFALDTLARAIGEEDGEASDIKINSKGTLTELVRFVKKPNGKAGGENGSHDDRVMSLAIGAALVISKPKPIVKKVIAYDVDALTAA